MTTLNQLKFKYKSYVGGIALDLEMPAEAYKDFVKVAKALGYSVKDSATHIVEFQEDSKKGVEGFDKSHQFNND